MSVTALTGLLFLLFGPVAGGQVGGLDLSFDAGVILSDSNNGVVFANVVTSTGEHLIAGDFTSVDGVPRGHLAKLSANGSVDQTFANGAGANAPIYAMEFDSSGRILIAGEFTTYNGIARNRIARLTSSGELDTTFDPGSGFDEVVYCFRQMGSSIFVGGDFTAYNEEPRNRLAVLSTTGQLDSTTFNGGVNAAVRALDVNEFGSILYAGGDFTIAGGVSRSFFAQFSIFGGAVSGSDLSLNGPVYAIEFAEQSNFSSEGKLFIGGNFTMVGSTARGRLASFNTNFNNQLVLEGPFNFWLDAACREIVATGIGKLQIAGDFTTVNGRWRSRYADVSAVSAGIGSSSSAYWDLMDGYGEIGPDGPVHTLRSDADGRVLLGGAFSGFPSNSRNGFLRLHGDAGSEPPAAPTSASALSLSDTQIHVSWSSSAFAAVYTLEGSSDGTSGWAQLYQGASTAFTEAGLSAGSTRFYRIQASNYNGPSNPTSIVSGTTNPAAWQGSGSLKSLFPPGSINGTVSALLRQLDGKILIAGSFTNVLGVPRRYIARLLPDLTLDPGFNPPTNINSAITQIQSAPDGGVYIFGNFSSINGATRNSVARLSSSGALDTSFNTHTSWTFARGILSQLDGKLIIFGNFQTFFGAPRNYIARLNLNGSVDTAFQCIPGSQVSAAAFQKNGNLLLAGWFRSINGSSIDRFASIKQNGAVDPSFAGFASSPNISSLASLPTGHHFASGTFTTISGASRRYIARLMEDGTVDGSFDPGLSTNTLNPFMFPQPNGKLIIAGSFTSVANTTRWKIARLNEDGTLDSTFSAEAGPGGPGNSMINSVLTLPDGSLLVGGSFTTFGSSSRSYLVQLKGDETMNVPSAPQHLAGLATGVSSILLNWDQLPDEYSWKVERRAAGIGEWQLIAELGWDVTSFLGTQLPVDTFFDYRIRAWNAAGDSPYSNIATVKTLSAFEQWKIDRDLPWDAPDSFDAYGNGVGLLLEYALGLDPASHDRSGLPNAEFFGSIMTMSYPRLRSELDYVVETSTDLVEWSSQGVNQGSGPYPTAWILTGNQPQLFLRLRVSR